MDRIRFGVIGYGGRGSGQMNLMLNFPEIDITAVCDIYEDRCDKACEVVKEKRGYVPFKTTDYNEVLCRDDVDAVVIMTNWELHATIAIAAMKAKKIVGLEVGGGLNVEECWEMVKTYEETKTPIMFLENCCFGREELLVTKLVRAGIFGEIVHCHGSYSHDLREEVACGKENRHYRLEHYLTRNCENYPTHELGPIAKILDINRGNRMVSLVSVASKAAGMKQFVEDRKDTIQNKDLIGAEFKQGDIINTIITCENGETISIKLDTTLPRYYSREFTVQGTKGMFNQELNSVFVEGDVHTFSEPYVYAENFFKNALKYHEEYLDERWKNVTPQQIDAGHGGMDYFEFLSFFDAIKNNKPMPIDVYDAAAWMCITPLSEYSIANGNVPVEIPDFTKGKYKERERLDV